MVYNLKGISSSVWRSKNLTFGLMLFSFYPLSVNFDTRILFFRMPAPADR